MRKLTLSFFALIAVLVAGVSCRKLPPKQALPSSGPNDVRTSGRDIQHREQLADVSPAFARHSQVDLNSGDIRNQEYSSDGSLKTTISETSLSREVRRLGIPIPGERKWVLLSAGPRAGETGVFADGVYAFVVVIGERLVRILDEAKAGDDERRATLEKFMTTVWTKDPLHAQRQVDLLTREVAGKHGLSIFLR